MLLSHIRIFSFSLHLYQLMRITINKLNFISKRISGLCPVRTGKSDVSLMFLDSVLNRSSSLADVDIAAFTGNPVYRAMLLSRLDSVFRSYYMYGFLTKCEVSSRSINSQKKNLANRPSKIGEIRENFARGIQRVVPSRQDDSILPARVANHSGDLGHLAPSRS